MLRGALDIPKWDYGYWHRILLDHLAYDRDWQAAGVSQPWITFLRYVRTAICIFRCFWKKPRTLHYQERQGLRSEFQLPLLSVITLKAKILRACLSELNLWYAAKGGRDDHADSFSRRLKIKTWMEMKERRFGQMRVQIFATCSCYICGQDWYTTSHIISKNAHRV